MNFVFLIYKIGLTIIKNVVFAFYYIHNRRMNTQIEM